MPPERRKQKYLLNGDDVVDRSFAEDPSNAENLVAGLNESGQPVPLAVAMGGLGNKAFTDQELIYYDATAQAFLPVGITKAQLDVVTGGSLHTPFHSDEIYANDGVDTTTPLPAGELQVVNQTANLPAGHSWVAVFVSFQFRFKQSEGGPVTAVSVRFEDDPFAPSEFASLTPAASWEGASGSDASEVINWIGFGKVPEEYANNSTLNLKVFMTGTGSESDQPEMRAVVVKYLVLDQAQALATVNKGIPNFLSTPYLMASDAVPPTLNNWNNVVVSAYVPITASALILQAVGEMDGQTGPAAINLRRNSSSNVMPLLKMGPADTQVVNGAQQGIFPFDLTGGIRSIDYQLTNPGMTSWTLHLLGYIS